MTPERRQAIMDILDNFPQETTFEQIMARLLGNPLLAQVDRREGSLAYNTLYPAAEEIENLYIAMILLRDQTSLRFAVGEDLVLAAFERGTDPIAASRALRTARFLDDDGNPLSIPIGSRFGVPGIELAVTFEFIRIENGHNILQCEQFGTVGNDYQGEILSLQNINGLAIAFVDGIHTPGRDAEDDESLRARAFERLRQRAFGGNVADYIQWVTQISGVGAVKVFPHWDGGGTVKVSVLDSSFNPASSLFISSIQEELDPPLHSGLGLGLAPIGHHVTVSTPTPVQVSIGASILTGGIPIANLQADIENALSEHILSLRKAWGHGLEPITIFISRIMNVILSVDGVSDVYNVTINGSTQNLPLIDTPAEQFVPMFEEVIIN